MPEWIDALLRARPGAERDYKVEWQWDRYLVDKRMFAAFCQPGPEHRGYAGRRLLTLKCDPARGELLRAEFPAILPGFYTDKRHWISIDLDGGVPEDVLRELCLDSYRLVVAKLTKKRQRELLEGEA